MFYRVQIFFTLIQNYFMGQFERLEKVAKLHFGSLAGIARLLDKKPQSFYSYKKRGNFGELLLLQLKGIGINPDYITDGKEPMLLDPQKEKPEPNVTSIEEVEMVSVPDITKMSPEQMLKWKKEALKAIEKIDKVQDALGG